MAFKPALITNTTLFLFSGRDNFDHYDKGRTFVPNS